MQSFWQICIYMIKGQNIYIDMQKRHTDRKMYFHDLEITSKEFYVSYLSTFKKLTSKSRVLEVGCGEGGNLVPFAQLGCRVTGIDIAECRIIDAKAYFSEICENATFVCCDFMKYHAPINEEEKFDVILLHDVIEHVPAKGKFLLHLKSFLKSTGVLFGRKNNLTVSSDIRKKDARSRNIAFVDTEVGLKDHKIHDIGALSYDGATFHQASQTALNKFLQEGKVDYICGHNLIHHDARYLQLNGILIDTLYLSPLLFPKRPYHHLVKDDKLMRQFERNTKIVELLFLVNTIAASTKNEI
jgi:2-polyprenyl-3-methyl-5-hydroxy-6-metoxy-1,4-benzoquinol methylase